MTKPSFEPCEVAWFAALCDDDYRWLGVTDPALQSSWSHCSSIVRAADRAGFDNVLLPSGYELGIDTVAFAGGMAALGTNLHYLVAVRCGEMWVPQLARQLTTLDQMLGGRLTVNIISSDLPGETMPSPSRYQRTLESMHALRALMSGERVDLDGRHVTLHLDAPRVTRGRSCPPFYFGGLSEDARETAAAAADVYLMWPDTMTEVGDVIADMRDRAARHGRTLRFGYRVHVVVRETEAAARAAADDLLSRLDDAEGDAIRRRSLDSTSAGVARQTAMRQASGHDGYIEDHLWTGIGRARSGCGAAIVGDPDQVLAKPHAYRALGIDAFILSGYPHLAEAERFGADVLPLFDHAPLRPRWTP